MSEFDDVKHLWKYGIGTPEKLLLGTMTICLVGFLATESLGYGFVGTGSFIGLMLILILKHS